MPSDSLLTSGRGSEGLIISLMKNYYSQSIIEVFDNRYSEEKVSLVKSILAAVAFFPFGFALLVLALAIL